MYPEQKLRCIYSQCLNPLSHVATEKNSDDFTLRCVQYFLKTADVLEKDNQ